MLENIHLAFEGIWSHKLRSILTMLGIIIGIAAIIPSSPPSRAPTNRSRRT